MAVVAGDIAIVGYNSTNPDQIAILAINAIAAGDGFFITDGGFISATGVASTTFRGTEGFVQYVAPTGGIAAGSVLIIDAGASNTPATLTVTRNGGGAAGTVTALANTGGTATVFNFAAAGDQISLYTVASGTHLTGNPNIIAFADFGSGAYTGAGSTNASNIPTIAGGQVLDLALDNAIFTNAANVAAGNIAAFNVATNFSEQNTTVYNLTTLASGSGSAFTAGNDTASNAATNDAIDGLGGFDRLNMDTFTQAITLNTVAGTIVSAEGGNDTVTNVEFFVLGSGDDVVTLGDSGFVVRAAGGNDTVTGGTGRDLISGGDGNDTLAGGSGSANELGGGLGDDTYIVSAIGDSVLEAAAGGTDTVETGLGVYVLKANVENLTYTGSSDFLGLGNDENNIIAGGTTADFLGGGAGNDTLSGGSGAANTLVGGSGNDVYLISTNGDTVVEASGEGIDRVETSGSFHRLAANVENLISRGSGDAVLFGNGENNIIMGGAGIDIIHGLGGVDTLIGGANSDYFFFDGSTGTDTITDFVSADNIFLSSSAYTVQGTLQFVANGAATTNDSTILFNSTTGLVQFDADGMGAGAAVDVVILAGGASITLGDVFFY